MTQPAEKKPFYTYLREERQFSFLLAFFLMQRGPALGQFLELAESRNAYTSRLVNGERVTIAIPERLDTGWGANLAPDGLEFCNDCADHHAEAFHNQRGLRNHGRRDLFDSVIERTLRLQAIEPAQ